jgi:hypothetical protein
MQKWKKINEGRTNVCIIAFWRTYIFLYLYTLLMYSNLFRLFLLFYRKSASQDPKIDTVYIGIITYFSEKKEIGLAQFWLGVEQNVLLWRHSEANFGQIVLKIAPSWPL